MKKIKLNEELAKKAKGRKIFKLIIFVILIIGVLNLSRLIMNNLNFKETGKKNENMQYMKLHNNSIEVLKTKKSSNKDKIIVNVIKDNNEKEKLYFDSKLTTTKELDLNQVKKYLEMDIIIPKLPKYLKETDSDRAYKIIYDKNSNILFDTFYFNYSENPKIYIDTDKRLNIAISKNGFQENELYLNSKKMKKSQVNNINVLLGYKKINYGPYKKPTGYYDMYIAEFSINNLEYQLESSNIEKAEFINIIKSFLN